MSSCYECKYLIETLRAIKVVNKITDTSTFCCSKVNHYVSPLNGYDCSMYTKGEPLTIRIPTIYDHMMGNRVANR